MISIDEAMTSQAYVDVESTVEVPAPLPADWDPRPPLPDDFSEPPKAPEPCRRVRMQPPLRQAQGSRDLLLASRIRFVSDFGEMYRPTEEHEAFRAAVREVCDAKVAPNAAEADELAEFPKASYEALRAADFHAPHIPEAYDGVGADALATVIVIEEVARACASSLADPGGEQARLAALAARRRRRSSSSATCRRSPAATRWPRTACPSRRPAPTRRA